MSLILLILCCILLLILFLIAPSPSRGRADGWRGTPFAHRGLHGRGAAENTLAAFERAADAGFGIELDVQFTKDGKIVVFHDDDLRRMTGDPRRVDEVDWAELKDIPLPDGGRIPGFDEVLAHVNGRVPLLVELKAGRRNAALCAGTAEMLRNYSGRYIVESFHPLILRWFKKNAPEMIRGQLVGPAACYLATLGRGAAWLLSVLALNFLARPDFVAYEVSCDHFAAPRVQRALFHTPLAAWTVRDEATYTSCLSRGEMPIFEDFVPEKHTEEKA